MIVETFVKMSPVQREKVHFTIVGDGTLRGELEKLCFEKGISKYIDFICVSNQVENYLLRSDIFMLPSRDEGFLFLFWRLCEQDFLLYLLILQVFRKWFFPDQWNCNFAMS